MEQVPVYVEKEKIVYVDKVINEEVEVIKQVPVAVEKLVPKDKVVELQTSAAGGAGTRKMCRRGGGARGSRA